METLTIGELARTAEVNLETIRYYERSGLIHKPPRGQSGYRAFPVSAVGQIRFIRQAQDLGFSLKEVKELLALRHDPQSTGADVGVRVEAKLRDIEDKMKVLQSIKQELQNLMAGCNGPGPIAACPIMRSLSAKKT